MLVALALGFSPDQYNYDDPTKGNRVYFSSGKHRVECLVYTYYTTTSKIVCDTGYVVCACTEAKVI